MEPKNLSENATENASHSQWQGSYGGPINSSYRPSGLSKMSPEDVVVVIFGILILLEFFFPVGDLSSGCKAHCDSVVTLPSLLSWPTIIFGFLAGASLFLKIYRAGAGSGPVAQLVGAIVGLAAAGFMVVVGFIGALVGAFRGQPPSS